MDSRLFEAIQLLRETLEGKPDLEKIREFLALRQDALREYMHNKLDPWVCHDCGSDEIRMAEWLDANSGQPVGGEVIDSWCGTCGVNDIALVRRSEFGKRKSNPSP